MAYQLFNRIRQAVAGAPGAGAIALGAALSGYQTFAQAGAVAGAQVNYVIEDGANWEYGRGTYSTTGPTLARTTIMASSSGGAAINASAAATVFCDAFAEDVLMADKPQLLSYRNYTLTLRSGTAMWLRNLFPQYNPGWYYFPFNQGTPLVGSAPAANTMYLSHAIINERVTIAALGVRITTGFTGGNFQLAIYNSDPVTGQPGTLVASTVSGSTTSGVIVNLAPNVATVLEPGLYWFAYMMDNTTAGLMCLSYTGPVMLSLVGSAGSIIPAGTSNGSVFLGVSVPYTTFGAWPADLTGASGLAYLNPGRAAMFQFQAGAAP